MSDTENNTDIDNLVRKLAELLNDTGLTEIEYGKDDWHIRIAKQGVPVSTVAAPVAAAPATEAAGDNHANHPGAVTSPMVGIVYNSPDPESPPFVKVGDQVNEGDTLLLIEAMKVFNPIKSPKSGKVSRILINSGTPVEFGEPLIIIE